MKNELFEDILKTVTDDFSANKKPKEGTIPTRIKYQGHYVVLLSKKTLWTMPRHAKSALTNHIKQVVAEHIYKLNKGKSYKEDDYIQYDAYKNIVKQIIEYLKNSGLKFVHADTGEIIK